MEAQNEHDVRVPFEMHAYDAIFTTVKVLQSQQFDRIHRFGTDVLHYLNMGTMLPLELQKHLIDLKNAVGDMDGVLEAYRRALYVLLDQDEDMAMMSLSRLKADPRMYM